MPRKPHPAAAPPAPPHAADALLDALIRRAREGICVCHAAPDSGELRFTLWNPRMAEITGYELREVNRPGGLAALFPDPEVLARAIERVQQLFAGEDIAAEEWEIVRKGGETRILSVSAAALGKSEGLTHALGLVHDVTKRRRAERAALEAERRYREFLNSLPQTVFECDLSGRFTLVNEASLDMFGYAREDVERGLTVLQTIHPDFRGPAGEAIALLLGGDPTLGHGDEWPAVRKDGSSFPIRVYVQPVREQGRPVGLRGIVLDVTEIKRAEAELAENEEKYRTLVQMFPHALLIFVDHRIVFANRAAAVTFGHPAPEAMLGRGFADGVSERDLPRILEYSRRRLAGEDAPEHYEALLKRRDGGEFTAELFVRRISYRGRPAQQIIVMDISERKRAEEALRRAREELEDKVEERTRELKEANARLLELDQVKSAFLSSASHELRTPLTSVLGFAKLIAKSFRRHMLPLVQGHEGLAHKASLILENLDVIVDEGERLTRLVNDLLDLNKIESGAVEWHDEKVDLAQAVQRAARTIAGQLKAKPGVALKVEIAPGLPALFVDRDRLEQVLVNLLHNAAKLTERGHIRVLARALDRAAVEVRVEDTGPGVPAADRERIFEKFYQVRQRNLDSDKPKGTGLGLAICRQIVEHYRGRIWVEGAEGKGSSFVFTLPVLSERERLAEALLRA